MGLHRAGFEVEGWDIKPQKHYPFTFHLGNALEADLSGFDFVWASPPSQVHTRLKHFSGNNHLDLIPETRSKLVAWGGSYIIENVVGAPLLRGSLILCGTMFGLTTKDGFAELHRHRVFESNCGMLTPSCRHSKSDRVITVAGGSPHAGTGSNAKQAKWRRTIWVSGHAGGKSERDGVYQFNTEQRREAMGIDWMNGDELSQAIPPAYSEFLGRQIIRVLSLSVDNPRQQA
jgi:DNA (cytosine-5)-methyltransferase 1